MTKDELKAIETKIRSLRAGSGYPRPTYVAALNEIVIVDVAALIAEIRRLRTAIAPVVATDVWYDGFAKRSDGVTVAMVPEPLYRALQEAYGEDS